MQVRVLARSVSAGVRVPTMSMSTGEGTSK